MPKNVTTRIQPEALRGLRLGVDPASLPEGYAVDCLNAETRRGLLEALQGPSTLATDGSGAVVGLHWVKPASTTSEKRFAAVDSLLKLNGTAVTADSTTTNAITGTAPQFVSHQRHTFVADGSHVLRRFDHGNSTLWPVQVPGTPTKPTVSVSAVTDTTLASCESISGIGYWNDVDGNSTGVATRFGNGTGSGPYVIANHHTEGSYCWHIDASNPKTGDTFHFSLPAGVPSDWTGFTGALVDVGSFPNEKRVGAFLSLVFGPGSYNTSSPVFYAVDIPIATAGAMHKNVVLSFADIPASALKSVGWFGIRVNQGQPDVTYPDSEFVVDMDNIRLTAGLTGTVRYKSTLYTLQGTGANQVRLDSTDSPETADVVLGTKGQQVTVYVAAAAWASGQTYVAGQRIKPTAANGHEYVVTTAGTSGSSQPTWPTTAGATVTATSGTAVFTENGTLQDAGTAALWRWDVDIDAEYHLVADGITGASYTDTVADVTLNEILQERRSGPPAAPSIVGKHRGRIVLAGSSDDPHGVYIGNADEVVPRVKQGWTTFYSIPNTVSSDAFTFALADGVKLDAGDRVVALAPLGVETGTEFVGDLLIFCETKVKRLTGDNPNTFNASWELPIGLIGGSAWDATPDGGVAWVDPEFNVWMVDRGLNVSRLSDDLHAKWETTPPSNSGVVLGVDPLTHRVVVWVTESGTAKAYSAYPVNGKRGREWVWTRIGVTAPASRATRGFGSDGASLHVGTAAGVVQRVFDPAATRPSWTWTDRIVDGQADHRHKTLYAYGTGTVTVKDGAGSALSGPYTLAADERKNLGLVHSTRWQLDVSGTAAQNVRRIDLVSSRRGPVR